VRHAQLTRWIEHPLLGTPGQWRQRRAGPRTDAAARHATLGSALLAGERRICEALQPWIDAPSAAPKPRLPPWCAPRAPAFPSDPDNTPGITA
jgi:hypothetical protein